ncbi:MAG: UDP-N-acetylmuramate dehydrogenase [Halomonas sp.]|nr:UDP-N-acetylmuramate dehydrogenase [Halomonas sp.]
MAKLMNILSNVDLTTANTLQLPCQAECFSAPRTVSALRAVLAHARLQGWPVTLLGGGSNVLLPEQLPGLVVQPALNQWWLSRPTGHQQQPHQEQVYVSVGAGVNWHALVMATAVRGLWGIENLALIPGSCGAAPVQNIGAYGVELADTLQAVQIMELASGRVEWLNTQQCAFGYRDSVFKGELADKVVITQLVLRLSRTPAAKLGYGDLSQRLTSSPTPLEVADAVCAIRREKLPDPQVLANAGSFFKNPIVSDTLAAQLLKAHPKMPHFPYPKGQTKLAAGWLIDQCGLKGMRDGAFGVHQHQALVLVHFGGGDRQGLTKTANNIASQVEARFGVRLEPEPRCINP